MEKSLKTKPADVIEMDGSDQENELPKNRKRKVGLIVLYLSLSTSSECKTTGLRRGSQRCASEEERKFAENKTNQGH